MIEDRKKIHGVVWIGLSQVSLLAGNFLLLKIITTNLSVADFGYYSLCMTFILFIRQIVYDPFSMVIAKSCATGDEDKKKSSLGLQVVRYSTDRAGVLIVILGFVFFAFEFFIVKSIRLSPLLFFCLIYLLSNGAQGVYINVFNSIGERKLAAFSSIVDSSLKVAVVALIFKLFSGDLFIGLASASVSALLTLFFIRNLVAVGFSDTEQSLKEIRTVLHENFMVSLPLLFPSLLNAFKSVGDRWLLAGFMGVDDLAAYTVLLQVGYFPVILLFGIVQTYMAPFIYKFCNLRDFHNCQLLKMLMLKILFASIIFACVSAGVTIFLADWMLDILVGPSYRIYAKYLSVFVFAGSLSASSGILQLIIFGVFDTKKSSKLIATSMVLIFVIFFILIYFLKFEGAIGGLVFAGIIPMLIFSWAVHKNLSRLVD